jgi:cell division protein FtsA
MLLKSRNLNKEKELIPMLSVDIGTETIKTAVFIIKDRSVEVVGYNRTKQTETAMQGAYIVNLTEVIDRVDQSIGKAIQMAEESFKGKMSTPKEVILGIAGELVLGVAILVNVERDNPEKPIEKEELRELIKNVKKNSFASTKEEISEEIGLQPEQIEEVETEINSVYIDSVRVNNPLKFKGSEITYRVFSTFAPRVHRDSIKQVAKELKLDMKRLVVQPYALSLALKNIRNNDANAVFIDIGGGTTDIALVQNGDIEGTKMFAIGGRMFTKRLQKDLGLSYEEAEDMKLKYSNDKLISNDRLAVKKALSKDIDVWLAGVELALESFEDVEEFPYEIYLCGGGALLPDIQEGLLSYPWTKNLKFKRYPKINFFFPSSVRQVVDLTKSATLPMDVTPLALARMSLDM